MTTFKHTEKLINTTKMKKKKQYILSKVNLLYLLSYLFFNIEIRSTVLHSIYAHT